MKILLVVLLLSGCATPMHQRFIREVKKGDPAAKVVQMFGEPDAFFAYPDVPDSQAWIFQDHGARCAALIKDDYVVDTACDATGYTSRGRRAAAAFGTALQGAGQGLQNGSRNRVSCHSTADGAGGTNTTCD